MKTLIAAACSMLLLVLASPARADGWDKKGWVKLGERTVNGKFDHDKVDVGKYEGKFTKLTMYVEKSDLELNDFEVTFGNGEHWHPAEVKWFFKAGTRTRVIDLPGDERVITSINLKYSNTRGGGNAKVEVWGWKAAGVVTSAPVGGWDRKGWVKLGERTVNGKFDHDKVDVGKYEGKFTKLTMYVEKSDLELNDFEVTFGNGERWHPADVKWLFKEGTRTRVIDLPGDERIIKSINLKYSNTRGGGNAKVEVWGWKA